MVRSEFARGRDEQAIANGGNETLMQVGSHGRIRSG